MQCWCGSLVTLFCYLLAVFGQYQHVDRDDEGVLYVNEAYGLRPDGNIMEVHSYQYPADAPPNMIQTWRYQAFIQGSAIKLTCYSIIIPKTPSGSCSDVLMTINDGNNQRKICGNVAYFSVLSKSAEFSLELQTNARGGGKVNCTAQAVEVTPDGNEVTLPPTTPPPPTTQPTTPAYLNLESEEIDSSEYGGPRGPKDTNCPCGWTNKQSKRIVNGVNSGVNEFPWMVALIHREYKYRFCGGSLITSRHALTAAHCTERYVAMKQPLSIVVGEHDFNKDDETNVTKIIDVEKIIQHEDYKVYHEGEDISLLLLAEEVEFNKFIGPACITPERLALDREYVKIIGWGRLQWGGQSPSVLQKVNVRIVPFEECRWAYRSLPTRAVQICTYGKEKASCQGDSGGPVVWRDPQTNRYVLVGLVSFGRVCADKSPSVHTDVSAYWNWIQRNIRENRPAPTCSKMP